MVRKKLHREAKPKPKRKPKRKVKINPRSSDSAELIQSKFKEIFVNPEPAMDSVQPVPEEGQTIPNLIQTQVEPKETSMECDLPHSSGDSVEQIQSKLKQCSVKLTRMSPSVIAQYNNTPAQPSSSRDRDQRYSHQQCQERMCVFCYNTKKIEKTQTLKHSSVQKKLGELDITISQTLTAPSETCRRKLFSPNTAVAMKELLNQSRKGFGFIGIVSETDICDCKICSKVRSNKPPSRKKRGAKPKSKPQPKPCCNICQKDWEEGHQCNSPNNFASISERLLNNVNPMVAQATAVHVIKESDKSPHGTARLNQGKGGAKLPVVVNSAKKRKSDQASEPVPVTEIAELKQGTNSTLTGARKIITFVNKISKAEKGAQAKLSAATRIFDEDFDVKRLDFEHNRVFKKQSYKCYQKHVIVYVKNISEYVFKLIKGRNLELSKCLLLVGSDGGGKDKSFKVTLNIINLLNDESGLSSRSSGSNQSQILAEVAGIPENYYNIKKIFELININDLQYFSTNDLKVDMIILGKQSCSCKFNCCFCESCKLELKGPLLTIGTAVAYHQRYLNFCLMNDLEPSDKKARTKLKSRNFKNHEFLPLLSNNFIADWNKKIIEIIAPPSLHAMLGFVKKMFDMIEEINFKIAEQWGNFAEAYQQVQHGGEFNGNACARLLENVDFLELLAHKNHSFDILLFVKVLRDFNEVRKKCFSVNLHKDWRTAISNFKKTTLQMHKDFQKFSFTAGQSIDGSVKELNYNFFVKLHVIAFHIEFWCENIGQKYFLANDSEDNCMCDLCVTKRKDNESVGIGLGLISEQPSEAVHKKFYDLCSRSFPFWNQKNSMYPLKRKRAVCTLNAQNSGFVSDSA